MGIGVKGAGATARKLEKIGDRSTRQLRRLHEQAANEIRDTGREMAPFKTGALEGDIEVHEERGPGGRKVFVIKTEGVKHAAPMHEGTYNLGPGSLEKQGRTQHTVGRKYLERAVDYVMITRGFLVRAARAVREGTR